MNQHNRTNRYPIAIVTSLVSVALLFLVSHAYAQATVPVPLDNWRSLLTPDALLAIAFLATAPLTALLKHYLGTEGTATVVVNVVANALAKGVGLYLTGAATLAFALVSIVLGIITDQAIYRLLVQSSAKGTTVVLTVPAMLPTPVKGGLQP